MTEQFSNKKIDNPRLISEMLLTHVLGGSRIDLYANANRVATDAERNELRELVQRAMKHEPVQYIVGTAWFFGVEFQVNSSTLIPRSCTERLVEQVIAHCNPSRDSTFDIAEIGTGSGCIAITLASNMEHAKIVATDISSAALELAQTNASIHKIDTQISFVEGDGVDPLLDFGSFDVICSNPPYIPDCEMADLAANVLDWEPKLALSGGKDGMDVISQIIAKAPKVLNPHGLLIIEIATSTRDQALALAQNEPAFEEAKIVRDAFGDDRFLRAIRRV
jgi:release factor glutamine methyltransferase